MVDIFFCRLFVVVMSDVVFLNTSHRRSLWTSHVFENKTLKVGGLGGPLRNTGKWGVRVKRNLVSFFFFTLFFWLERKKENTYCPCSMRCNFTGSRVLARSELTLH